MGNSGGSFWKGVISTNLELPPLGIAGGFISGFGGGFTNGLLLGTGNSLLKGNSFRNAFNTGLKTGFNQGLIGGTLGAIAGGKAASKNDRNVLTGKKAHYLAELEGYDIYQQHDYLENMPKHCKDATLYAIEKFNGGTRSYEYFCEEGANFIAQREALGEKVTLEDYFCHFGFDVYDAPLDYGTDFKYYGNLIDVDVPVVLDQSYNNGMNGHTLTIVKIRQMNANSPARVWFADPSTGRRFSTNWSVIGSSNFNRGIYIFDL